MKQELRKQMLGARKNLSEERLQAAGNQIFLNLQKIDEFCKAESCFCYVDFKNEVPTQKIREFFANKSLYIPVVDGDIMHAVKSGCGNKKNIYGIDEPVNFEIVKTSPNISVIPLLACDKKGNRVGFGKGYYDKYLADKKTVKIGICYSFQVVDNIPSEPTDVRLDYIVTEKEIIKV